MQNTSSTVALVISSLFLLFVKGSVIADQKCDPNNGVAMMMLARPNGTIAQHEAWRDWKRNADTWASANGCPNGAPLSMYVEDIGPLKGNSDHLFKWVPSVECEWGDLLPCQYKLLNESIKAAPDTTQWFALVSDDSVPYHSFAYIYEDLNRRNTSRFGVSKAAFARSPLYQNHFCPKHSQWNILKREHALALTRNDTWVTGLWLISDKPFGDSFYIAASDEYSPLCFLQEMYGSAEKLWPEINDGQPFEDSRVASNLPMYYCWQDCEDVGICSPHHHPCVFTAINATSLAERMENSHAFFIRKVSPDTMVYQGSDLYTQVPLRDYLLSRNHETTTSTSPSVVNTDSTRAAARSMRGSQSIKNSTGGSISSP